MPLYLGVMAMHVMREELMACEEMHDAHAALSHIDLTGLSFTPVKATSSSSLASSTSRNGHEALAAQRPLERLIGEAVDLMDKLPPNTLLGLRLDENPAIGLLFARSDENGCCLTPL